jgi:hypothetical protein
MSTSTTKLAIPVPASSEFALPPRRSASSESRTSAAKKTPAKHISDEDISEMSAAFTEGEPETTATALRQRPSAKNLPKEKRSYKTVDQNKRQQLIRMVHVEQKTIKDAANRLKINYSTAKHIVKSHKDQGSLQTEMVPRQCDDHTESDLN